MRKIIKIEVFFFLLDTLKTTSLDLHLDSREDLSEADGLRIEAGIFIYTETSHLFSLQFNKIRFTSIIDWPMQKKNNNVQY